MIGKTLNHYKIIEPLGAGGMGEVYRAHDTTLKRDVAIKVLPEELARDPERLTRLEREATAVAALDHPNIVTVFSVEEAAVDAGADAGGHVHFITMQLVEGKTLSELIPRNGLPLQKFFDLAIPLADAISAAHEQGIIHRDLKPANVMVSDDGRVRVLDFGLAKLKEDTPGAGGVSFGGAATATDSSEAATEMATVQATSGGSAQPLTEEGKILGTVAYMSPEQAEGKAVDHRTDIFSLGILLYEMATGTQPFQGDTNVSVISSIVKDTPTSVTELNRNLPRHLGRIMRRALEKDVRRRYQAALDLRNDLEDLHGEIVSGELDAGTAGTTATKPTWQRALPWAMAGVVAGAAVASLAVWSYTSRTTPTSDGGQFVIPLEEGLRLWGGSVIEHADLGFQRPSRTAMAFSPDGRHLVYAATDGAQAQLYLRRLDQDRANPIPGARGCCPFFSPDGQSVGFYAWDEGWSLKSIYLSGVQARTIASGAPYPFGATWGDNGTIVFADGPEGGLLQVPANGGTPKPLTEINRENGETSHRLPHFLPGGNEVLFTVVRGEYRWEDADIVVKSLRTGEQTLLIEEGADARYVPTGHLVFSREGVLMGVPFDPVRLAVLGDPVLVQEDVMQACFVPNRNVETGAAQFSFSALGHLAYVPGGVYPEVDWPLLWVDREGEPEVIDLDPGDHGYPRISPDGRHLAYTRGLRSGETDLWIYDIRGGDKIRLTFEERIGSLAWSPDSERIVFGSARNGTFQNLYVMAADGTGDVDRLTNNDVDQYVASWSPAGVLAIVDGESDIWLLEMKGEGEGELKKLLESPSREQYPDFSPDGGWITYASNRTGRWGVYVQKYPGPGAPIPITTEGGRQPSWSQTGQELYYREPGDRMMVVNYSVTPDGEFSRGMPRTLFEKPYSACDPIRCYDVATDGRFVMLAEAQGEPQPVAGINIFLNWFEELKRRVPTGR